MRGPQFTKAQVFRLLLLLVVAWGAFLRMWGLSGRAFWRDEAWVAQAAQQWSYSELLRQTEVPMPPLFAVCAKLLGSLVAPAEVGLRMPASLGGIALVALTYLTVRTLRMPRTYALAASALCASSLMLVTWSRELKHYQLEAFFSVLIALLVFRIRRCSGLRRGWPMVLLLVVACLLGPWLGYGMIFPATALLGLLVLAHPASGNGRILLVVGLTALLSLAVSTWCVLQVAAANQVADEALLSYVRNWFIDPRSVRGWLQAGARWASTTYRLLFPYDWIRPGPWHVLVALAIWIVAAIGLAAWPRRGRWEMTCWTVVPWLFLVGAAVAQRYPFGMVRTMVSVAPPLVIAVAAGTVTICRQLCLLFSGRPALGMVLGLLLALLPAVYVLNVPLRHGYWIHHNFPAVLRVLERQRRPGEIVFVDLPAVPSVRFYVRDADEFFTFVPTTAGTLMAPGYSYREHLGETARKAGERWWYLRITPTEWSTLRELPLVRATGYQPELVAEAGSGGFYGKAQLFALTRPP